MIEENFIENARWLVREPSFTLRWLSNKLAISLLMLREWLICKSISFSVYYEHIKFDRMEWCAILTKSVIFTFGNLLRWRHWRHLKWWSIWKSILMNFILTWDFIDALDCGEEDCLRKFLFQFVLSYMGCNSTLYLIRHLPSSLFAPACFIINVRSHDTGRVELLFCVSPISVFLYMLHYPSV